MNDVDSWKEFLQAPATNTFAFFLHRLIVGTRWHQISLNTEATDHEGRFTVDAQDRVKKARWKQVAILLSAYFICRFYPFLPS